MGDFVMVDWFVPIRSIKAFKDSLREKYGSLEGHYQRHLMTAMEAFAERDGYEGVEDYVDRLVQAAGRTPTDLGKEKSPQVQVWRRTSRTWRKRERQLGSTPW